LISLDIGKYSIYQLISLIVTINRPTEGIGFIVNCIIGSFFGIVLYYALSRAGQDYLIVKSFGASLLFWALAELIFTSTIEGRFIDIRPISDYYTHLAGASSYGITVGLMFKAYLFNPSTPSTL